MRESSYALVPDEFVVNLRLTFTYRVIHVSSTRILESIWYLITLKLNPFWNIITKLFNRKTYYGYSSKKNYLGNVHFFILIFSTFLYIQYLEMYFFLAGGQR
jgi:hypothetical protein